MCLFYQMQNLQLDKTEWERQEEDYKKQVKDIKEQLEKGKAEAEAAKTSRSVSRFTYHFFRLNVR